MRRIDSAAIHRRRGIWWTTWALLAIASIVLGVGGCGGSSAPQPPEAIVDKGTPFGDLLVPKVQASVTDGAIGVPVESPVTVTADAGVLGAVTLVNEEDRVVAGELSPDGVTWSSAEPLGYNRQYTLNAEAQGLGGVARTSATFETHSPQNLTMPFVQPNEGEVVGVGQPIAVRFDETIPDRLAAQRAITVTTNPPVEGAFYWLNDREVRWRPAQYWKPGTSVEVQVKAYGVDLGQGLFGQDDASTRFTVGDEVIATADDTTKTMTVRVNGNVVKTMPISMGKDKTPTDKGTYVVGDRYSFLVMDSSTYGVPVNSPTVTSPRSTGPPKCPTAGSMCTPPRGRSAVRAAPTSVTGASMPAPRTVSGSTTTPNAATSSK